MQSTDTAAVMAVMTSLIDAWNRHDMDAFANLFTEDADFVNVVGTRWIGRDAIGKAHAATHATIFKNSQLTLKDSSLRFLKSDIAVLRAVTEVTGQVDGAGRTLPPRDALLTLIMITIGKKWSIAVAQNTNIIPPVSPDNR